MKKICALVVFVFLVLGRPEITDALTYQFDSTKDGSSFLALMDVSNKLTITLQNTTADTFFTGMLVNAPEPGTIILLGCGLLAIGIFLMIRRRRKDN